MISPVIPDRSLHTVSVLSAAIFQSLLLQIKSEILAQIKSVGFFHVPFSGPSMCCKCECLRCPFAWCGLWYAWCICTFTSVPTSTAVLPLLRGRHRPLCLLSCRPQGTGGDTGLSLADVREKNLQWENKYTVLSLERCCLGWFVGFFVNNRVYPFFIPKWHKSYHMHGLAGSGLVKVYFGFNLLISGDLELFCEAS